MNDSATSHAPRVTVLIPVYNRARFIDAAIDSILGQTLTDYEIVVIDDASTDESSARVAAYRDPRIRLLRNTRNQGIAATRNRGIRAARGDYIAFLDSDDRAMAHRLGRQTDFLDAHPDHAAVGGWIRWIDADGAHLNKTKRKAVDCDQIAAERLFRSSLENTTVMARADILRAFPHREDYALGSDYELWARINAEYRLAALPEVLVERRRHGEQATAEDDPAIREGRLRIFADQLTRLGLCYGPDDLERHYLLRRMHKTGFRPDTAYLNWAERWLGRLRCANHQHRLYPEPAFTAVLGVFWAKTCLMALRGTNWRALVRFWRSPLRAPALAGLRAEARTRLRFGA